MSSITTFFDFLISCTEAHKYIGLLILCCILMYVVIRIVVYIHIDETAEKDIDLCEQEDYVLYEYSKNNYLCIYDDAIRFRRGSAYISDYIYDVIKIKSTMDDGNRVIKIISKNENNTVSESIHCGKMSDDQYTKIKQMIFQAVGG